MKIDIWSDLVCPWCYLGRQRLMSALDEVGRDGIEIRWHAFQLDPSAPREPSDLRQVIEAKYGPGAFDSMTTRLTSLGAAEGIDYRFDRALRVNTSDAHRIVAWAADVADLSTQDLLVAELFRLYFTDGADLCDYSVLEEAAERGGLDREQCHAVLTSNAYVEEIAADQRIAQESGITGVPAMVIDDHWMIPGAQDVDRLCAMLTKVRESVLAQD